MPPPLPETTQPKPRRNWRDIAQSGGHRRSSTGIARRRRLLVKGRWLGMALLACAAMGAAGYGVYATADGVPSAPRVQATLSKISFRTDGVLDDRWFVTASSVRPGDPMDGIDIHRIKASMEARGQVREATVTIRMPDELVIDVRERVPVLRARVAKGGETATVLIARDGTVYEGFNYPQETLNALPYLGGVSFRREGGIILPVQGMEIVTDLLDAARHEHPEIYSGWRVVSLERYRDPASPAAAISVASRHGGEVIFAPVGLQVQLDSLAHVMRHEASRPKPKEIVRIDLSLPAQAIVEYKETMKAVAGARR